MSKKIYNGEYEVENAICGHCGKVHNWDAENCAVYNDKFICENCFQNQYGYCNDCYNLFKYADMNDDIICKKCSKE